MKTYSVHTLPWSADSDGNVVLVAESFSWPALIFGPFWALWHGMWRIAIALFLIAAIVGGVGAWVGLAPDAVSVFQILIQLGLGLWGNDLRRAALGRKGYIERAVVAGGSMVEAEGRYFSTVASDAA